MAEYIEQSILLDVMDGDLDAARHKLADFYPTELNDFDEQVDQLSDLIGERRRAAASGAPQPPETTP